MLGASSNNTIYGNNITANNGTAVSLVADIMGGQGADTSSNNIIYGNNMTAYNGDTICLCSEVAAIFHPSNNSIFENNVVTNQYCVQVLNSSSGNFIYHNNFSGMQGVHSENATNVWDNGYPSGGNHWSEYTGIDIQSGTNQDIPGSDGIGDTPYVIDANNRDNYPFMELHDISVASVTSSRTIVGQNYLAFIMVTVRNLGAFTETFNVSAYYNETAIPIYEQWPNSTQLKAFWSMGDVNRNGYIDYVDAGLMAEEFNKHGPPGENPADINSDGIVDIFDEIQLSNNYGYDIWTRLGIPYPALKSQTIVTLPPRDFTIVTFIWNTTGVAKGIYTIRAYATPVLGETSTTDNARVNGNIRVATIGDINGDGRVDMKDIAAVAKAFGAEYNATDGWYWHSPDPCIKCPHDPNYDITGPESKHAFALGLPDGKINMVDIGTVARNFGQMLTESRDFTRFPY